VSTAPDGSPVDLFLRLPSFGEAERIHELLAPGEAILEFGCGVGRVTHELIRLGHRWEPQAGARNERGGVTFALEDVRVKPRHVSSTARYEADGRTWRHPFVARLLDDKELDGELAKAGLRRSRILDERGAWVEARIVASSRG
jgi:SAM-dependent methyltransferase